jgi:chromosome segregation ATPase
MMTMDFNQASKMLAWLDEERRKDKAEIAALQQRLIGMESTLVESARRIQELEGRAVSLQTQLNRLPQVDKAIDRLRQEMIQMIEEDDARYTAAARESEKVRRIEHDSLSRTLADLKKELTPIPQIEGQLAPLQAEQQRLNAVLANFEHAILQMDERIEERVRDVTYLEEGRRQDARKIAELQQEVIELRKKIEVFPPKLDVLEDLARRTEVRITEISTVETERRQEQTRWIEHQGLTLRERERRLNEWEAVMNEAKKRIEEAAKRVQLVSEQQQVVAAAVTTIEAFKQRIEQRQNEVGEIQRLAEDRIKQQWAEFVTEEDKRWKQLTVNLQEKWRDHERPHREAVERLTALEEIPTAIWAEIKALWQLHEAHTQTMTEFARNWLEDWEGRMEKVR